MAARKNIQQPFDLMALITGKVMLITSTRQLNLIFQGWGNLTRQDQVLLNEKSP